MISRHLDGALNPDEELQFQRAILRDPEARRTLEAYERLDAAAAEALQAALPEAELPFDPVELTRRHHTPPRTRYHRAWWLLPAAVAACLGGLMILRPMETPVSSPGPRGGGLVADGTPLEPVAAPAGAAAWRPDRVSPNVMPASAHPRRVLRHTDRELIGVMGEDGEIYWIEVDQIRTLRGRSARGNTRLASGGL